MRDPNLLEELRGRELRGGGWSFFGSRQVSLEATSLAALCLLAERPFEALRLGKLLSGVQLADGSWPSFVGDRESSWTTAIAICALNSVNDPSKARERGESWLLRTKGQEGHWFWRWKFKTADRNVQFDPDKYGWPWISGSASWVIPTAFSIIAIEQFTVCNRSEDSEKRIHLGVEMLLDRACVDGGWNSGNSVVYGVPLRPHVGATAVALLSRSGPRVNTQTSSGVQPVVLERNPEFMALPTGTRLIARLQTPVSSAVKTPVVAAIEYNYERDGEIVIPAGSKAFGELSQVNDQGYVGIQFHTIQMPDETTQKIEGHAVGLQYQPLRGQVTGRNTGKKFLVRSLTGVGAILAATVGVQSGTGVTDALSNNVLLRERVANNVAVAGEQQLNDLAYHQNIVVTVPGNTRFYIVLAKPAGSGVGTGPAGSAPAGNPSSASGYAAAATPSVQELRELMELRRELTQMYQQQQKALIAQTAAEQQ